MQKFFNEISIYNGKLTTVPLRMVKAHRNDANNLNLQKSASNCYWGWKIRVNSMPVVKIVLNLEKDANIFD